MTMIEWTSKDVYSVPGHVFSKDALQGLNKPGQNKNEPQWGPPTQNSWVCI